MTKSEIGPIDPGADLVTIETPEHVVFNYEVAGVMSRVLAAGIDGVVQGVVIFALFIVMAVAAVAGGDKEISMAAWAMFGLGSFVVIWGYSILFEIFMRGQTPGKRLLGLRVIREGGYALTPREVIVRNLMRFADFLPSGYGLGLIVVCLNRRNKRIGDFVAGTLVIHDAPIAPPPQTARSVEIYRRRVDPAAVDQLRTAGVHRLTAHEVGLIESYLDRRPYLDQEVRMALAVRFARRVAEALGIDHGDPELFLQCVVVAYEESQKK